MRQKPTTPETPSERLVRDIRRATRKQYSAEEKIRIILDDFRGEVTIAKLCRREASPRANITAGRRSSWKLASGASPAKRRGRRPSSQRGCRPGSARN